MDRIPGKEDTPNKEKISKITSEDQNKNQNILKQHYH